MVTRNPKRPDTDESGLGRIPPQDLEAEMSLLGSMMLSRDAIGAVLPIISRADTKHLYRPDHRLIFETLVDVYDRNDPIDIVILREELRRRNSLEDVGGVSYIVQLAESVPDWGNAEYYARIVRDKGLLRDLIRTCGEISSSAYDDSEDTSTLLDKAEQKLFDVTEQRVSQHPVVLREPLQQVYEQIMNHDGALLTGLPSGYHELDEMTSGFQQGDLVIVAGRPSMGKTAFGLCVAEYLAIDDRRPVIFFSLEMGRQQVAQRLLCSRGRVDAHKLRRGFLDERELGNLGQLCGQLESAPLFVDDTPGMSVLEIRAKARRLKSREDIQAVFVDYLQLMHNPGQESRQQEIAAISRGLKGLGRELGVPVIAMAQLNRSVEGREGNRPRMSDLRESGAIEQDADVVILLHREEYYKHSTDAVDDSIKGVAEAIIAKQRNGPVGTVKLAFFKQFTRFDNYHQGPVPAQAQSFRDDAPF